MIVGKMNIGVMDVIIAEVMKYLGQYNVSASFDDPNYEYLIIG